jgi:transcriptional regulator with XRE-family HTH domain
MDPTSVETGRALRRAREARGLSLRALAAASGGRFKATSIAGYERGERSISVTRFCELCTFYGVSPDRVLAHVVRAVEGTSEPIIDLALLESLDSEEAALVSGFVRQVRSLRAEGGAEAIILRTGDLEILATASGRRPDELTDLLRREPHDD